MAGKNHLAISTQTLCLNRASQFVADPAHGAANTFIGTIRNHNLGRSVIAVSYDVFDELALKTFVALATRAREKWGDSLHIYIEHRKGRLDIGDISILITVSSPHREESFKACRFLIEAIKHRCPIWKQEHYQDGDSQWVQGHALCSHASIPYDDEQEQPHAHP
jgi:molybdopterin synthase catalytic subunit